MKIDSHIVMRIISIPQEVSGNARLAQSVEHRSYEPKVMGSSPISSNIVTLQQIINHYLRFDGHSNNYVLTAIPQNKAFYLLYMNIALNASCIRVILCLIWCQTLTETYSKYLYHYLWPDAGSIPVAARESVGWYLWKTALFPEPFCLILFYLC